MKRSFVAGLLLLVPVAAIAQTDDVDWKFYGGANVTNHTSLCFYDEKSIESLENKNVKVWVKCAASEDLDKLDANSDAEKRIVAASVEKLHNRYVPPVVTVIHDLNSEQITSLIIYEETANSDLIKPESRLLYELNCPERQIRTLSVSFHLHGKDGGSDSPGNWMDISPETNVARLFKLLCKHPKRE